MTKLQQKRFEDAKKRLATMMNRPFMHPGGQIFTPAGWEHLVNSESLAVHTREGSDFTYVLWEADDELARWAPLKASDVKAPTPPATALALASEQVAHEVGRINTAADMLIEQMKKLAASPADEAIRKTGGQLNEMAKTVISGEQAKIRALEAVALLLRTSNPLPR